MIVQTSNDYLIWNYPNIKTFHHLEDHLTGDKSIEQKTECQLCKRLAWPFTHLSKSEEIVLPGWLWSLGHIQQTLSWHGDI